ncbi:MAG: XamI family restriction endonuclease [Burkholderiales bacterium]|nr:XamI family restriction endonuclease [Burkholderiales bacterium]
MSTAWPRHAPRWTDEEIVRDAAIARQEFRQRRFGEPRSRYLEAFAEFETANGWLLPRLERLLRAEPDADTLAEALRREDLVTALRYVGGPPISLDDLKTLAESTLAASRVQADGQQAQAIAEVLRSIIDPKRLPWIEQGRAATPTEQAAALLASSVLVASQRVQTARRGDERAIVEGSVRGLLVGLGFTEVKTKPEGGIRSLRLHAPPAGSFMRTVNLGADNADLVIGLGDGRVLAVECKGSNSEINSRKRLNKEAVQNARAWLALFGREVVPAVAIQGVFKAAYVKEAQETPLVVFWGHRPADLKTFIEVCR